MSEFVPDLPLDKRSLWLQERPIRSRFDRLSGTCETDVLVVGAGITGLTVAIELASRGRRVVLREARTVGAGTTAASTWPFAVTERAASTG